METATEQTAPDYSDISKIPDDVKRAKLQEWRENPVLYFKERLGIPEFKENGDRNLDVHEVAMLNALPEAIYFKKPVVVSSANGMGKDYTISGRAALWFFECFGPCKVIQTATGERQVLDIMWNELKSAYNARPCTDSLGKMTSGKLEAAEDWFITAFTTKEQKDQPGKFQGVHSPRLMIIVSEAQGVDDVIFEQIKSLMMAGICLPVFLGNPLTNIGMFAKMIEDTKNNIVIHLSAFDSINVKEKREIIPGMTTWDWVEARRREWDPDGTGKDPRWQARVLGQLPTSSINSVISKELYLKCINRDLSWWSDHFGTIGVDPAGMGTDDMVISVFKSGKLTREEVIPFCEAPEACARIAVVQQEEFPIGGCVVVIESDGMGAPICQFYRKMIPATIECPITVVEFHGSCSDRDIVDEQYHNHRAEANFYAKERMMEGHICLDANEMAQEEATSVLYFTNPRSGKLQIEDKEDLKSRLHRSPNRWDARVCGIWGFKFTTKIEKKSGWASTDSQAVYVPQGSAMSA